MTEEQFNLIGEYLTKLWPSFSLNEDQGDVWRAKLGHLDFAFVKSCIADAYAKSRWKEPALGDVMEAIASRRKIEPATMRNEVPDEVAQRIMDEDRKKREAHAAKNGIAIAPSNTVNVLDKKRPTRTSSRSSSATPSSPPP